MRWTGWLGVAAALLLWPIAASAEYPDHPIRIVVPFPAGGSVDVLARQIAQRLTARWGQSVKVDNRAGANSVLGTSDVARAAPDGYTLLVNASTMVITPHLVKAPYDPDKDFAAVALLAKGAIVVAVKRDLAARSIAELIELARAHPGGLDFAIGSNGSACHLATELLMRRAGIKLFIVPYKGSTPAYQDLIAGSISGMLDPALGILPHVKSGAIRALAVTSSERIEALPDTPTVAEQGMPGFAFYSWYGLWAPGGTPPALVARLNGAVDEILAADELRALLASQGFAPQHGTPAEFAAMQAAENRAVGEIVRESNIKAE